MSDLLPCPFCGGRANIYENEVDFFPKWSVGCGDCNADLDVCEDEKQEAAVAWNTRAPQPVSVAQAEQQTDELGLYDLGESFLAEYERAVKDGALHDFVCADSPVEALWHLINQVDDLHAALEPFAAVAIADIGQDETDADIFQPMRSGYNRAPLITVGDMRRAASTVPSTHECTCDTSIDGELGLDTDEHETSCPLYSPVTATHPGGGK